MPDSTAHSITHVTAGAVNPDHYRALTAGAAIAQRTDSGVLRVTDADRADFLQRMTTNNIQALGPGRSAVTVLTSPTARILFVFTVVYEPDTLLLLPAVGQSAALLRHLRGQIFFMDKVKVHDVSDDLVRLRVLGPQAAQALATLGLEVAGLADNGTLPQDDLLVIHQQQYGVPGYELVVPAARQAEIVAALASAGAVSLDDGALQARRVELGRPAPGAELVEEYNPLEAGLAWACAENKGCYTGQEIIARQITYDKVTRTLVGLVADRPLAPGDEVTLDGRNVGAVTSSAYSPALDKPVALAILKRPANAPGTAVQVGDTAAQVVALPFVGGGE
jgi:folate-binding protein YgfZ